MGSFDIVEDKVVDELFSEAGQIINEVEVIVDALFLKGPVKRSTHPIDLWATWIGKVVRYPSVFQIGINIPFLRTDHTCWKSQDDEAGASGSPVCDRP